MTDFLTADTNLPSYMMFPRFLLDMEINETAKMLYIILLDRARLLSLFLTLHLFYHIEHPIVSVRTKSTLSLPSSISFSIRINS